MIGEKISKGDLVYLRLESFQPAWRQALVVQCSNRGSKLYMAVRVLDREIEKDAEQISFFEIQGSKFILVEGKKSQIRTSYAGMQRALEVDSQAVLERALEVLEQQNLNYVTASDDVPESSQRKPTRTVESSSSSEQMSASEDEDDKILEMLKKAKRAGKGKGIAFEPDLEESKSKGKKYPLLERKKESQAASSSGLDKVLVQTLKSSELQGQEANINTLVSLELLKAIQGKKKLKNTWDHEEDEEKSSGDSSSDSGERKSRPRGAGKALRDYREGHKQMRKNPLRHVRRYIREIESGMGVSQEVAIQPVGLQQEVAVGQEPHPFQGPLCGVGNPPSATSRKRRTGSAAIGPTLESSLSGQSRQWVMEGGGSLDVSSRPAGAAPIWGRARAVGAHRQLLESNSDWRNGVPDWESDKTKKEEKERKTERERNRRTRPKLCR